MENNKTVRSDSDSSVRAGSVAALLAARGAVLAASEALEAQMNLGVHARTGTAATALMDALDSLADIYRKLDAARLAMKRGGAL